ncbi:hypothetical protein BDN71DRAFT_1506858 [Pleurotus eryngii]|uniref:Uncharacterized protein n=1 Tax=Pleurotus eryngii TaxID=5323 RepID=A0A9P5ZWK4_PLEER|nr:hypothetical protein BDN71DRAFT_1506858 [Pleurotus eryngii]
MTLNSDNYLVHNGTQHPNEVQGSLSWSGNRGSNGMDMFGPASNSGGFPLKLLWTATHQMLIQSGNQVYALVREQNINLAATLDTQKQIVAALLAAQASENSGPSDFPLPPVASAPFIKQEERGDIKFYHLKEWEAHFQTESRGANKIFNTLYHKRQDPFTWGKKLQPIAKYYYVQMRSDFPKFHYCDGGEWKAEKFASLKYSDWCKDTQAKGNLTRRNKSIQNGAPALIKPPQKKAKVSHPHIIPKCEPECIDLSSDVEMLAGDNIVSFDDANVDKQAQQATPLLTLPANPIRTSTPILTPATPFATAPSASASTLTTASPVLTPSVTSSTMASQLTPATPSAILNTPTVSVDGTEHDSSSNANSQPRLVAAPTSMCLQPCMDSSSVPPRLKSRKQCTDAAVSAKKSALVKPSEAQIARNLYCVDYLKVHPKTTAAEFKVVWDMAVPDIVKQSYNLKSRIIKSKRKAMTD